MSQPLRILAFADTHGKGAHDLNALRRVREDSPDILIHCGDWTYFQARYQGMNAVFAEALSNDISSFYVTGNHETIYNSETMDIDAVGAVNLHLHTYRHVSGLQDMEDCALVYGLGTYWNRHQIQQRELDELIRRVRNIPTQKRIFVCHEPPVGYVHSPEFHCVNTRRIIDATEPTVALVGHIHTYEPLECQIGATRVINPGPWGLLLEI